MLSRPTWNARRITGAALLFLGIMAFAVGSEGVPIALLWHRIPLERTLMVTIVGAVTALLGHRLGGGAWTAVPSVLLYAAGLAGFIFLADLVRVWAHHYPMPPAARLVPYAVVSFLLVGSLFLRARQTRRRKRSRRLAA